MKKKLLALMLMVGLLPSSVFATTIFGLGGGLDSVVYGNISPDSGVSTGQIGINFFLSTENTNLTVISGSKINTQVGGFTALGNGEVNLSSHAGFDYGMMTDDPWEGHAEFSRVEWWLRITTILVSPDEVATDTHDFHQEARPGDFDVWFGDSPTPLTLSFNTGERGFWILDTAISGNLYVPYPVPEPTAMLLLGSGLIGLVGYGRKKFFKK